jgi:hypothetical protein
MPVKKPVRSTSSEHSATPEPPNAEAAKSSAPATRTTTASVFVLVAVCVIVAAVVIAVRDGSEPVEVAAADTKVTAASSSAAQPNAAALPKVKTPARTAVDASAAAPSPSAVPGSSPALSATVTITGCLERSDKGFRLKNTTGADAPKSRTWKTGFFTKRSASIDVNDERGSSHLAEHLGERVSLTGALIDREMIVHSLRSIAASCK